MLVDNWCLTLVGMTKVIGKLKGELHVENVFLIHASNGELNGEVIKYTFLNFFIPE